MKTLKNENMVSDEAVKKACEYSDKPEELWGLLTSGITFEYRFIGIRKYFDTDEHKRQVLGITITRNGKTISFEYGSSLMDTDLFRCPKNDDPTESVYKPISDTELKKEWQKESWGEHSQYSKLLIEKKKAFKAGLLYSILTCIRMDYATPDTFEEFCMEFGYDEDSRKAEKVFGLCKIKAAKLHKVFAPPPS